MSPATLPIHERFHTWQGEGDHMGKAAFFLRTFGCPVHCTFCDSAGTWHPNWVPKHVTRMTVAEIQAEVEKSGAGIVVITGGEPAIHDLNELTISLKLMGRRTHIETSGAFALRGRFDWVTVSPKRDKPPLSNTMEQADEFKLIIEHPDDIEYWSRFIEPYRKVGVSVWLHPEWSQRNNPKVLNAITDWVKMWQSPFRAGWQLHKLYKADTLDNRAAAPAPLGGQPDKGY